jgi:hypothetical protein
VGLPSPPSSMPALPPSFSTPTSIPGLGNTSTGEPRVSSKWAPADPRPTDDTDRDSRDGSVTGLRYSNWSRDDDSNRSDSGSRHTGGHGDRSWPGGGVDRRSAEVVNAGGDRHSSGGQSGGHGSGGGGHGGGKSGRVRHSGGGHGGGRHSGGGGHGGGRSGGGHGGR